MAQDLQSRDRSELSEIEQPAPLSLPASARGKAGRNQPSAETADIMRVRAAQGRAPGGRPVTELLQREDPDLSQNRERGAGSRKGLLRPHPIAAAAGLLLSFAVAAVGYVYWDYAQHFETTDDAFIAARQFAIAPKVSGYITAVPVTDNQHVAAGDVIARVDQRDYRNALAQAQAQVASAEASIESADAQISVQQAQISANQAQVQQAQAALVFGGQQEARYQQLARQGYGSVQNFQQWSSQQRQDKAALESARATLNVAKRQIESLNAQRDSAVASLAQAKAVRDQAQLNLSYTTVRADQAGRVVQLSAAVGEFAEPGTNLTMFVPDKIWVDANFKETQLDAMRPGQKVALEIDAYPERSINGRVASVQPGSGTAFSLLPAENATGNYVKIVQRVPVKIVLTNAPRDVALGPGMSVVPSVRVDPTPSLYERLRVWL
jgi:membrane fusion protein (multidrug efflux system)